MGCDDHRPVQHRDGKEPWCESCRLTKDFRHPRSLFGLDKDAPSIPVRPGVRFHTPYRPDVARRYTVDWPQGWPVPREEEAVYTKEGIALRVRSVSWYPHGDEEDQSPYVYVVLGPWR